jgi:hypothetical protein
MLWIRFETKFCVFAFSRKLWGTIRKFPKKGNICHGHVKHMDLFVTIFGGHKMFKKKDVGRLLRKHLFLWNHREYFLESKRKCRFFRKLDVFGDLHKCFFENGNVWRIFAIRKFRKISPNYKHFAKMETGIFVSTLPWLFIQIPPWNWGGKTWRGTFVHRGQLHNNSNLILEPHLFAIWA